MPNRRDVLKQLGTAAGGAVAAATWAQAGRAARAKPERIKIGQIGTGHAHASKLSAYRQSDDYEVVGIAEPDAELRGQAQDNELYRDLSFMTQQQLLDVPGLQAVLIETRVRDLLDAAEAAIAAGKHIHLDKPAGESLPQFKRILQDAERQKLLVQMGYMYRYNPGIVMLREFLERGWLGEPFEVHTVMSKVVSPGSRQGLKQYPGGIMFELGCHITDLVVGVLGKPDQVTPFVRRSSPLADGLNDNMLAVLEYPRATATVKSSATEVEGFARRHFVVCGTEGTFHVQPLDKPAARVALSKPRGKYARGYQDVKFPKYTRYVDDAADMARIIRGEKQTDFLYEHDLTVQTTLLQACGLPTE